MRYKNNSVYNFIKVIIRITAIINSIAMAYFFKTIFCGIFEYLFISNSQDEKPLNTFSTYLDIVEKHSKEILYLHYLVLLHNVFYIS